MSVPAPTREPQWIDNHCHLDADNADEQVLAAQQAGVVGCITVGTSLSRSHEALAIAERFPNVWATAGVHPHDAIDGIDGVAELLAHPKVVAVGEAGLDYHYDHSPREQQRDVFAQHVALANKHDLPLIIHTREAWDDTFSVLDREGTPRRTVFHCFTGGADEATACVARGAMLSISGLVTFKNADDIRAAVIATPIDRLMIETDSPYLAPVPFRGKRNQPANAAVVGLAVAALKGCEVDVFSSCALTTTKSFYSISEP